MFSTPQDLFSTVATVAISLVTIFLCWALYEIALLVHQANRTVKDTREKVERFEKVVQHIAEKIASSAQYLGFIAEGGKQLLSMFKERHEETKPKKNGKRHEEKLSDLPEDEA